MTFATWQFHSKSRRALSASPGPSRLMRSPMVLSACMAGKAMPEAARSRAISCRRSYQVSYIMNSMPSQRSSGKYFMMSR